MKLATLLIPTTLLSLTVDSASGFQMSRQYTQSERQGLSSVSPLGLLLDSATETDLGIRSSGVVNTPPTEWSTSRFGPSGFEMPDFSKAAIMDGIYRLVPSTSTQPRTCLIESISTGGDVNGAITTDGRMHLSQAWYALSVSLAEKPAGNTYGQMGSTIRSTANAAGAITSYYFVDSTDIDEALVDSTMLEQTSDQVGFGQAPIDLKGLDWGMGAIATDPSGQRSDLTFPVRDKLFFTVSPNWAEKNLDHFSEDDQANQFTLEPDQVYYMEWSLNDTGTSFEWSAPQVAFSDIELFGAIDSGLTIDAISVYWDGPTKQRIVYSTNVAPGIDQILGYDRVNFAGYTGSRPVALANTLGDKIVDVIGVDDTGFIPDDIDSVCTIDPKHASVNSSSIGFPLEQTTGSSPNDMGLAIYRGVELNASGVPVDTMTLQVTGLDVVPNQPTLIEIEIGLFDPLDSSGGQFALPIDNAVFPFGQLTTVQLPPGVTTFSVPIPGNIGFSGHTAFRVNHFLDGVNLHRRSVISGINY